MVFRSLLFNRLVKVSLICQATIFKGTSVKSVIDGLKPASLWNHFYAICQIPHGSKNEAAITKYVTAVATSRGLAFVVDAKGNVVVKKPASRGREKNASLALQCHLDMVCEKNADTVHDFLRDPLKLIRVGDFIKADGTTLGADNGVGVASLLALMEATNIAHGPLELLFTVDEEVGLGGALGLSPDLLTARRLINLDSEEEGELFIGCAGGIDTVATLAVTRATIPAGFESFRLRVSGLKGGHSGLEIHSGRANAIALIARVLKSLTTSFDVRLLQIAGGNKRNAIAREVEAVIVLPRTYSDNVCTMIAEYNACFNDEFELVDPSVSLVFTPHDTPVKESFTRESTATVATLLSALPHGVISMSTELPELVETSTNLAIVHSTLHAVTIETSQRSAVASRKNAIAQTVRSVFECAGAVVEQGSGYPGWKPNPSSELLAVAKKVYHEITATYPKVKAVHAGLECGIIGEKYPGMDMISIGPNMAMVHSPDERLDIYSVERYWNYLTKLLEQL